MKASDYEYQRSKQAFCYFLQKQTFIISEENVIVSRYS